MKPIRVGIIGVGNVLNQYLDKIGVHPEVDIVALADVNEAAVTARAKEYGVRKALSPDQLLADPAVIDQLAAGLCSRAQERCGCRSRIYTGHLRSVENLLRLFERSGEWFLRQHMLSRRDGLQTYRRV